MKIRINTDNHIKGREQMAEEAEAVVESAAGKLKSAVDHLLGRLGSH